MVGVKTWKRGTTSLHARMKVGKANAQDEDVFKARPVYGIMTHETHNPGFGLGLRRLSITTDDRRP
jgi:hypothetical protein